jgi:uncharacterized protein YoxC
MRIRDAIRGRITGTIGRIVLVAGGALVGWLLFAGPVQAAPSEGDESGGLLGLVPVPPVLEEPDRAAPAAEVEESAEPVVEVVEQVTEPVEQVAEPVERVTESVEQVAEPVERVTESVEQVAEPVERVTESVEQVTEPVERVTESVAQVVEPVTQVVDQATTVAVDPVTEILADPPVVPSLVDPVVSTVDPVVDAVEPATEPVTTTVSSLVEAVADPVGQIAETGVTDAGLPAVLSLAPAVEPVTAAEPLLTLSAAAVDRTSLAGPLQPPVAAAGTPPWWPGPSPAHAHPPGALASPAHTGPVSDPDRVPGRRLPAPVPGSGTYQLAGNPTDNGPPLAWTGPATVEPSADPVRLPLPGDVVGSGQALPISPPPG